MFLIFAAFKIRSSLHAILVPTWLHFPSPSSPKSLQKTIPKGIDFLIDFSFEFLSILPPFWEPSWSHVGQVFRTKLAQEASKSPHEASKAPQDASQDALGNQNPPRPPPGLNFDRFLIDFWSIFDRFLIDFVYFHFDRFGIECWLKKIGSMLSQPSACSAGGAAPPYLEEARWRERGLPRWR